MKHIELITIGCIILLFLLIIITIYIVRLQTPKKTESFKSVFLNANPSSEYLQYLDMIDHKTMVYLQRGNSNDTVLLLHNCPLTLDIWQPLFQTMQRTGLSGIKTPNLVAYDLRGNGTAWIPVENKYNDLNINNHVWSLEQFANDCKRVYDQVIETGTISVCGYGFGGKVGQKFAQMYPNLVKELIILQATTKPSPGFQEEINYLGGPNGWIARNPTVTYLTSEETWIDNIICSWFYLPENTNCPRISNPSHSDVGAPQVELVRKLYRQGSSTTTLQTDKLLAVTDLSQGWKTIGTIPFKIHILAASDDPLSPPDMMTSTFADIYNVNRSVQVTFDVVTGRHGFSVMNPDYIVGILCKECGQMPNNLEFTAKTNF